MTVLISSIDTGWTIRVVDKDGHQTSTVVRHDDYDVRNGIAFSEAIEFLTNALIEGY